MDHAKKLVAGTVIHGTTVVTTISFVRSIVAVKERSAIVGPSTPNRGPVRP